MTTRKSRVRADLRRFGFALGGGLSVLGGLLHWKDRPAAAYVLGVAVTLILLAAVLPRALAPLEWLMSRLFKLVTTVLTYVILTLVFLLILTPLGLIRRLMGKDGLGLEPTSARATYWIDVKPDGPGSRPDKPF